MEDVSPCNYYVLDWLVVIDCYMISLLSLTIRLQQIQNCAARLVPRTRMGRVAYVTISI